MLDSETRRRIDNLRDILVGKLPGPESQVEQITTALIYKFMHDMDQESIELGGVPSFFIGDFEKYSWKNLFRPKLNGADRVKLYMEAIEQMSNNPTAPPLFREIFKNSFLPFRDPATLNMFLKEIDEFHYSHSENLGDAFEYLLQFMGSQGDAGQFRTPRHIIDFIVEIVDPKKNEAILDPSCGTAGFLISSYKHILKQNTGKKLGDKLTASERKKLGNNLVGYDISPDMTRISLVNMYLHQFASPKIHEYDTLSSEDRWNEYYDVILANPPFFSPKGGITPHSRFGVKSPRAEVLFVDYIMEHLKPRGRAGIIVPEGIIFQTGKAYTALRKKLVENYLVGVVSLPVGVFQPYSGVKTSILLLDRGLNQKLDNIFFATIKNDGFSLGSRRTPINENDLPTISKRLREGSFEEQDKLFAVQKSHILQTKEVILSSVRYIFSDLESKTSFPMVKLGDIVEIQSGAREKGGSRKSGIPSIGGAQIDSNGNITLDNMVYVSEQFFNNLKKGQLIDGDVLIVKDGATTGKIGIYTGQYRKASVNEHVFILRSNEETILNCFLFHLLRTPNFRNNLKPYIQGIIGGINLKIKNIQVPLPPIDIQKEIVKEIDRYQKIIDGCRQVVENYKPIIDIDTSWKRSKLGDVISLEYGKSLKMKDRKGGKYPVFGSNGIVGFHDEFIAEGPCIIVGRKGSAGEVTFSKNNSFPIDTTFFVKLKDKNVDLKFIFYSLRQLPLKTLNIQSAVPGLNRNDAYNLEIPLPSIEIQQEIVEELDGYQTVIDGCRQIIENYAQKIQDKMISTVWGGG